MAALVGLLRSATKEDRRALGITSLPQIIMPDEHRIDELMVVATLTS
jgi:hypothetical protein